MFSSPSLLVIQIVQQANSHVCLAQQQEPSLCCTNAYSQNYLCSSSYDNAIQQCSAPQPEYIYMDSSSSSAMQPILVDQLPYYSSSSGYSPSPQYLCVSQAPTQGATSIVFQPQPQVHAQSVQFVQSPQPSAEQYIQISSATPQFIQRTTTQSHATSHSHIAFFSVLVTNSNQPSELHPTDRKRERLSMRSCRTSRFHLFEVVYKCFPRRHTVLSEHRYKISSSIPL